MKKYEFMAEKYPLFNNDPKEAEFPIPEGYECFRVCRYGDGYVYRVLKELTDNDEHLQKIAQHVARYRSIVEKVEILPYHTMGTYKYQELAISYPLEGIPPLTTDRKANAISIFKQYLSCPVI